MRWSQPLRSHWIRHVTGRTITAPQRPSIVNETVATQVRLADFAIVAMSRRFPIRAETEHVQMRDMNLATQIQPTEADTRSKAIGLMTQALELIDDDASISGVAGAHLQMAIDSLWRTASTGSMSLDLH